MIIVKSVEGSNLGGRFILLYADSKEEVPSTGTATVAALAGERVNKLATGDVLYTADFDIAVLKSDDTWNWEA